MNATKFESLAQKNVDHFDAHPVAHTIMVASYGVCAVLLIKRLARKMTKTNADVRQMTGQFAK